MATRVSFQDRALKRILAALRGRRRAAMFVAREVVRGLNRLGASLSRPIRERQMKSSHVGPMSGARFESGIVSSDETMPVFDAPKEQTIVFCTAYAATALAWEQRVRRWIDAVRSSGLAYTQILIVDDGSPVLPSWPDVRIVHEGEPLDDRSEVVIYHFEKNLGRNDVTDFPGWFRSFAFPAIAYAHAEIGKLIHLESDAFLISRRVVDFVNDTSDDWAAMYCKRYVFPEIAIQIIAGSAIEEYRRFCERGYGALVGTVHERTLPIRTVATQFIGDRYGEFLDHIPMDADWATQTLSERGSDYFWWLGQHGLNLGFGLGETGVNCLREGWAAPEAGHVWSVGAESRIIVPRPASSLEHSLRLALTPCLIEGWLPFKRVEISIDGKTVIRTIMRRHEIVELWVPAATAALTRDLEIRLHTPDAIAPNAVSDRYEDTRALGLDMTRLWLEPITDPGSAT